MGFDTSHYNFVREYGADLNYRKIFFMRSDMAIASTADVCCEKIVTDKERAVWMETKKRLNAAGEIVVIETFFYATRPSWIPESIDL